MSEWKKVELQDICDLIKGETAISKAISGKYPLVVTGANRKNCSSYQFDTKAVCIPLVSSTGHGKKTLNYVHYQEGKFALGTILVAVIPKEDNILNAKFLHLYLSYFKDRLLVPLMRGAANVSLPIKAISKVSVPLPSITEQEAIVKKTNNCDELEQQIQQTKTYSEQLMQTVLKEAFTP